MEEEWVKCFSKSRKRDYYFNNRTGESVWTLEEMNEQIKKEAEKSLASSKSKSKPKEQKPKVKQKEEKIKEK